MAHIKSSREFARYSGPDGFEVLKRQNRSTRWRKCFSAGNSPAPADREMIATYVSSQNDCYFCQHADGAVVAYRLDGREKLVNDVRLNVESTAISDKMKAPLAIAGRVQKGGKQARPFDVDRARQHGATDRLEETPSRMRNLANVPLPRTVRMPTRN